MPTVVHIGELTHCGNGMLMVLWAGTLIASATCVLLIYSIASFRNAPDSHAVSFVRRTALEVVWAMIPILILISTAMPSVKSLITAKTSCSATQLR